MKVCFQNDNFVELVLPGHPRSHEFANRDKHEIMFRRISTLLINAKFITRNIIDTGAWIGDNSIPWAKNISGTVYAIDPSPNNCSFMMEVCQLNNISNVLIIQAALSDKEETLSTHQSLDHCWFRPGTTEKNCINATTLDILYEQGLLKDIDYAHIDVEGMEPEVIHGMERILNAYHPIVAFEQHLQLDNVSLVIDFLKAKNYMVFMINETLPGCRDDCRNFLAFPDDEKHTNLVRYIRSYFGNPSILTCF
jgi:FkbM family methyltransferase